MHNQGNFMFPLPAKGSANGTMRPRSTLTNSGTLTAYYLVDAALLFALALVLARYLGVTDFGKLAFALSYGLLLTIASDPGISLLLTKLVARTSGRCRSWIEHGIALRTGLTMVVTLAGLGVLATTAYFWKNAYVIVPVVLSEQARGLTLTYCALFRGFQRMSAEVVVIALERTSILAAVLIALTQGHGVAAVAWIFLAGRLLSLGVAAGMFTYQFGALRMPRRHKLILKLFRHSAPLGILVFAERINMYYAPFVLALLWGDASAGLFQAAFKVVTLPVLLSGVIGGSLFPAMSAAFRDRERVQAFYRYGIRVLWHVLLPGAVFTAAFAPQILSLLFGSAFVSASTTLQLLTATFLVAPVVTLSYYLMPAVNCQRIVMRLSFLSLGLNFVLVTLLAKLWAAEGAAAGLLLTNLVVAVGYWYRAGRLGFYFLKKREDVFQVAGFVLTLAAGLLLRITLRVAGGVDLAVVAALIFTFYSLVLFATSSILPAEMEFASSLRSRLWG